MAGVDKSFEFVNRSLTTKTKYHREYHRRMMQLNASVKRSSGMCYIHTHTHNVHTGERCVKIESAQILAIPRTHIHIQT